MGVVESHDRISVRQGVDEGPCTVVVDDDGRLLVMKVADDHDVPTVLAALDVNGAHDGRLVVVEVDLAEAVLFDGAGDDFSRASCVGVGQTRGSQRAPVS